MEFSTLHLFLILCHIDLGVIVVVVISKNNNYFFVAQMKNCQLISQRADSKYESGGLIFFICMTFPESPLRIKFRNFS